jgi:hypothetical protein
MLVNKIFRAHALAASPGMIAREKFDYFASFI